MNISLITDFPLHLLQNGRSKIDVFFEDEVLYRRDPSNKKFPFSSISLADISTNRSGNNNKISCPNDSKYIVKGTDVEIYSGVVYILSIKRQNFHVELKKTYRETSGKDGIPYSYIVEMYLVHKPDEYNYAHTVIEITFQGKIMSFNPDTGVYNRGLGRKDRLASKMRSILRDEIQKMVIDKTTV